MCGGLFPPCLLYPYVVAPLLMFSYQQRFKFLEVSDKTPISFSGAKITPSVLVFIHWHVLLQCYKFQIIIFVICNHHDKIQYTDTYFLTIFSNSDVKANECNEALHPVQPSEKLWDVALYLVVQPNHLVHQDANHAINSLLHFTLPYNRADISLSPLDFEFD